MKAVRFHQHGGPDVLRYEEAPDPELSPGEVLVRVRACAVNHLDADETKFLRLVRSHRIEIRERERCAESFKESAT